MAKARTKMEKLLFPGAHGQRRRHMRFFLLALFLGVVVCAAIGAILYTLNINGRI